MVLHMQLGERLLARFPRIELAGYRALGYLKMPGPSYFRRLAEIHAALKPQLYVEIGIGSGASLDLVSPATRCVAIDPNPSLKNGLPANISLYRMGSDEFFKANGSDLIRNFDLAFIDGGHSFAQALRDFENVEAAAGENSIVLIHDVVPADRRTSAPEQHSSFWTGDVWRLMAAIVNGRPDLFAATLACVPSGLGIVGRFNRARRGLPAETVRKFARLPFVSGWQAQRAMLNIVGNRRDAVARILQSILG
jgi:hypothetical protein